MYIVFTCMPGELPQVTQVFVVVLVLRISSANERPCVLILRLSACLFPVSLGCCQHVMSWAAATPTNNKLRILSANELP